MQSSGPSQHQYVPSLVAASVASHWATTVVPGFLACAFALDCLPSAQSQRGPFPILNRSLEKAGCSMNVYCIHGKVSFLLTKGLWESKSQSPQALLSLSHHRLLTVQMGTKAQRGLALGVQSHRLGVRSWAQVAWLKLLFPTGHVRTGVPFYPRSRI